MASTLTRMLTGEIPCEKIFEDNRFAAVLEPAPLSAGHAFVFPKQEIASWLELEPDDLRDLMALAQRLARVIRDTVDCPRVALAAYGVRTPHAHIHLIPVWGRPGEIDLTRSRPAAAADELHALASRIRALTSRGF